MPSLIVLAAGFVFCLLTATPAFPEEMVRVLVMDDLAKLSLHIPGGFDVEDRSGSGLAEEDEGGQGTKLVIDRDSYPAEGIRIVAGDSVVNINEYALTGIVEVKRNKKGLFRIINELDLERYTASVVGEEMSSKWDLEALKAQAVVARTYALFRKSRSGKDGYDLCATVNSQMFTGGAREKEGPQLASKATEGEVLSYGGELVETLYHSTCGGKTEAASDVWDRPFPYLRSMDCICHKDSPYCRWERTVTADELEKSLSCNGYKVSGVASIKVLERSKTGRVRLLRVKGASGSVTLKGFEFRRVVGYSRLPSTCFDFKKEKGLFVFSGRGSGHGVGLCQWGAKDMAEEGRGYRDILGYYYPGTVLSRTEDGKIRALGDAD